MKSLSLAKPLVLMMIGRPGAGKSFFARQFSTMFGAPLVSYDRLRFELFSQPTYSNEEQDIVDRIAGYQAEELFKTNRTFIIDGGCNVKTTRMKLAQLAKTNDYNTLAIWVQTDEATCRDRATRRNPKREDDKYNLSLTPDQFEIQAKRLTDPNRETYVVISGKHTYNTQARAVLKKLVEPRAALATEAHEMIEKHTSRPLPPSAGSARNIIIR